MLLERFTQENQNDINLISLAMPSKSKLRFAPTIHELVIRTWKIESKSAISVVTGKCFL